MNDQEKIQMYIVINNNSRIDATIVSRIKKYFNLNIERIEIGKLSELEFKKVHLIIFDNIIVKDIQYSLINKIQKNNKHLHTGIVGSKLLQKQMTKIYDNHIDYIFQNEFDNDYFVAKLKTILKRKSSKYLLDTNIAFKNIVVNQLLGEVYLNNKLIDTTTKEYKIIRLLVKNNEQFLTKEQIFKVIWKFDKDTSRVLDQYLHRVKKKLGQEVSLISDRNKGIKLF